MFFPRLHPVILSLPAQRFGTVSPFAAVFGRVIYPGIGAADMGAQALAVFILYAFLFLFLLFLAPAPIRISQSSHPRPPPPPHFLLYSSSPRFSCSYLPAPSS